MSVTVIRATAASPISAMARAVSPGIPIVRVNRPESEPLPAGTACSTFAAGLDDGGALPLGVSTGSMLAIVPGETTLPSPAVETGAGSTTPVPGAGPAGKIPPGKVPPGSVPPGTVTPGTVPGGVVDLAGAGDDELAAPAEVVGDGEADGVLE